MIRLSQQVINNIRQVFLAVFGSHDALWIFGSRTKPEERGGDIDLYIETECNDMDKLVDMKLRFLFELKNKIGDQKIDVVIKCDDYSLPIYKVAREEGVRLV